MILHDKITSPIQGKIEVTFINTFFNTYTLSKGYLNVTKKFKQLFQCVYVANFCSGQKFGSLTTTGNTLWPDLVRLQLLCKPLEDVVHNLMSYQMKERYF